MDSLQQKCYRDDYLREEVSLLATALYSLGKRDYQSLASINKEIVSERVKSLDEECKKRHIRPEVASNMKDDLQRMITERDNISTPTTSQAPGQFGTILPPRVSNEVAILAANQGFITSMCTQSNEFYDNNSTYFLGMTLQAEPTLRPDQTSAIDSDDSDFVATRGYITPDEYTMRTFISHRLGLLDKSIQANIIESMIRIMASSLYRQFDQNLITRHGTSSGGYLAIFNSQTTTNGLINNRHVQHIVESSATNNSRLEEGPDISISTITTLLHSDIDYRVDSSRLACLVPERILAASNTLLDDNVAPSSAYKKLAKDKWVDGILVKSVTRDILPTTLAARVIVSGNARIVSVTRLTGEDVYPIVFGDFSKVHVGMSPFFITASRDSPSAYPYQRIDLQVRAYFAHTVPYNKSTDNTNSRPVMFVRFYRNHSSG